MRQRLRCFGVLAAAGIAVTGLTSCGLSEKTSEDSSTLSGKITSVRWKLGSGAVTVHGEDGGGKLTLRRTVRYEGSEPKDATHTVKDGVLILGDCGNHCSVDYTVEVPAGVPVTGQSSDGAIDLSRVGAVKVATSSGRVTVNGASGAVEMRTSNGKISGRRLSGDRVRAHTSNGAIDLTASTPQNVRARTSNGAIDLTTPKASYQVTARTSNGKKDIDVTDEPSGTHRLDLRTDNGSITVRTP